MEVGHAYIACFHDSYPHLPTTTAATKKAKVGCTYASQVIQEFILTGTFLTLRSSNNNDLTNEWVGSHLTVEEELFLTLRSSNNNDLTNECVGSYLTVEEKLFLLSLWTESSSRHDDSYARGLSGFYGTTVTSQYIGLWFQTRFDHSGRFCKPNLVPKEKFMAKTLFITWNFVWFWKSYLTIQNSTGLTRSIWSTRMSKQPTKVRADPLTGYIPCNLREREFPRYLQSKCPAGRGPACVFFCLALRYHLRRGRAIFFARSLEKLRSYWTFWSKKRPNSPRDD
jgi:hypothetical protein